MTKQMQKQKKNPQKLRHPFPPPAKKNQQQKTFTKTLKSLWLKKK